MFRDENISTISGTRNNRSMSISFPPFAVSHLFPPRVGFEGQKEVLEDVCKCALADLR